MPPGWQAHRVRTLARRALPRRRHLALRVVLGRSAQSPASTRPKCLIHARPRLRPSRDFMLPPRQTKGWRSILHGIQRIGRFANRGSRPLLPKPENPAQAELAKPRSGCCDARAPQPTIRSFDKKKPARFPCPAFLLAGAALGERRWMIYIMPPIPPMPWS